MSQAYQSLLEHFARLHRLSHLQSIAGWDQAVMMPRDSASARANALSTLEVVLHEQMSQPWISSALEQARQATADAEQQAALREMHRHIQLHTALPATLVEQQSLAGAHCEHAWRTQRPANDWAGFCPNLETVVRLSRQEAEIRSQATGLPPYDALLAKFEPGLSQTMIDQYFDDIKSWLPELIQTVREQQADWQIEPAVGPFSRQAQEALGRELVGAFGFDWQRGRLDVSTHPFSGGVPEDVRITTRYDDEDFAQSLMGVIHETGHGAYEQNLPRHWLEQPLGRARSMGVHESQSLAFEMQLARSDDFLRYLQPKLCQHFGRQDAFEPENLMRLYRVVKPGFIRVDADELTYPLHVILRYEIERDLMQSTIEVADIPALWHEKMQAYLGLSTLGNDKDGCMQDIHWTLGAFGYFPTYTLGAMYAAQLVNTAQSSCVDWSSRVEAGDFSPLTDFMREHIWLQGSRYETPELIEQATGEGLNPAFFKAHLEKRYG